MPRAFKAGDRVRFIEPWSTGVLPGGGPSAPDGYETDVFEVGDPNVDGVRPIGVRMPYDGGTVGQFVPDLVLEVVT